LLVATAFAVAAVIRLIPWHRHHPAWFLAPHSLTVLITIGLLDITGGVGSPFRLLLVADLLFCVAYFDGWPLAVSSATVAAGFAVVHFGPGRTAVLRHGLVEGLCLMLIALIGWRTIQGLRVQRRRIIELNERIEQQRTQVVQATQTRTAIALAGGVAHELNQPLTVLLAESERLSHLPQLPPELREAVEQCFAAAGRAALIVQRLQQLTTHTTTPYVDGVDITALKEPHGADPRGG
jgi:signal transduction histidine kinase